MTQFEGRVADHEVDEIFLRRWSPRAFTGEAMPRETLLTILEAARWAPSSYNSQPWRFVYGHRGTAAFDRLLGLLGEFNRGWCAAASVLLVQFSKETMRPPGRNEDVPSWSHSFDAGAAWGYLALEATRLGWHAHGMVGFDRERAGPELGVPAGYRVEAMIALGRKGDPGVLPEPVREREKPSGRERVESFAFEGRFAG